MLDGKELEGKFGSGGSYALDIDASGEIIIAVVWNEAPVKSSLSVQVSFKDLLVLYAGKLEDGVVKSLVEGILKFLA